MRDCCLDLTVMEQHSLTATCLLVHSQTKTGVLTIIIHCMCKETVKPLLDPFCTFGATSGRMVAILFCFAVGVCLFNHTSLRLYITIHRTYEVLEKHITCH